MILLFNEKPLRRFGRAFRQRDAKCRPGHEGAGGDQRTGFCKDAASAAQRDQGDRSGDQT